MFGIPGEIFWPTAAFASIILVIFGGVALLRLLPSRSRSAGPDKETLEDLQARVGQLETLQERVAELEERVDFTERLIAKEREGARRLKDGSA